MAFPNILTVRSYGGGAIPSVLTGSGISSTGTTFTVASVASWLENDSSNYLGTSGPFVVAIDYGESNEEKVLCSAINPSTNTVTVYSSGGSVGRAYDNSSVALGTSAGTGVTHAANAVVVPVLTSVEIQQMQTTANKTIGKITTAGDLLVGDASQSLTRIPIGSNGQVFTADGTTASWQALQVSQLPPIPNSALIGTGSTSGQILTSTGPTTIPTWQRALTSNPTSRIYKSSTQSISSSTTNATLTAFDGTDFNLGPTVNLTNGSITIATGQAGKYLVAGRLRYGTLGANATRINITIFVNGAAYGNTPVRQEVSALSGGLPYLGVSDVVSLAAGDVLTLATFQNSGGAVNVTEAALSVSLVSA